MAKCTQIQLKNKKGVISILLMLQNIQASKDSIHNTQLSEFAFILYIIHSFSFCFIHMLFLPFQVKLNKIDSFVSIKILIKFTFSRDAITSYLSADHSRSFIIQSKQKDMSLIRKPAPQFKAPAWYNGDFVDVSLSDYKGKYVVLFFYPLDFTFVCPTEIIAFSNKAKQFREIGCQVLACSVDSKFSHMEYSLKSRKEGGLGPMEVPLISDINKTISTAFGCLCEDGEDEGVAYRATYIIDRNGIVRHSSINDLPVGRNPDEYLRLVKAFQFVDEHGEVCPAGWQPGQKSMVPDPKKNQYKEVINEAK